MTEERFTWIHLYAQYRQRAALSCFIQTLCESFFCSAVCVKFSGTLGSESRQIKDTHEFFKQTIRAPIVDEIQGLLTQFPSLILQMDEQIYMHIYDTLFPSEGGELGGGEMGCVEVWIIQETWSSAAILSCSWLFINGLVNARYR